MPWCVYTPVLVGINASGVYINKLAASNNKINEFRNITILMLVLLSFASCSQKNLADYYSCNVADLGFFVTRIQLNEDSTFK